MLQTYHTHGRCLMLAAQGGSEICWSHRGSWNRHSSHCGVAHPPDETMQPLVSHPDSINMCPLAHFARRQCGHQMYDLRTL